MNMENPAADARPDDELITFGAASFHDAIAALCAFQKAVQDRCIAVMKRHIGDYSAALGVTMTEQDIEPFMYPIKYNQDFKEYWDLGAIVKCSDIPNLRWWETACCLYWEEGKIGCHVYQSWSDKDCARAAHHALRDHSNSLYFLDRYKMLGYATQLEQAQLKNFDECLEELLVAWINDWKKVGGMLQFISPANRE